MQPRMHLFTLDGVAQLDDSCQRAELGGRGHHQSTGRSENFNQVPTNAKAGKLIRGSLSVGLVYHLKLKKTLSEAVGLFERRRRPVLSLVPFKTNRI